MAELKLAAVQPYGGVTVTLSGSGALPVSQWQSWTDGRANLSAGNYVFASLENAAGTAFQVNGGTLDLPNLPTLVGGSLSLASGATASVPKLSNMDGASSLVSGGVTLAVPLATIYTLGSASATLRATGNARKATALPPSNSDPRSSHTSVVDAKSPPFWKTTPIRLNFAPQS